MVPIGVLAGALLYVHWRAQEHERERSQIESVRLLAASVDNALESSVERLSIFARLWSSRSLSEQAIYEQAREALMANADWSDILAFSADGRGVFQAEGPFGGQMPLGPQFDVWQPVFSERRPVVSDVFAGPEHGAQIVAVGVPIIRGAKVTHVLIADLNLIWYDRLMRQQGLPPGAVAGLIDRNFNFVARSSEGPERRGQDPSPAWVADMKRRREGLARYTNLNGTAVYTAWTVTRRGWGVGFATPSAPVDNAFWNHLRLFGLLWAAAVGAGVLYAISKARPIAASLESLEDQAEHFATGERIASLPDSSVDEVNRALAALEKASELLHTATRERDRSLAVERAIRVIERQSHHLSRLLDDLLDVGRAMTGKIVLEHTTIDLAASARHVIEIVETTGRLADRRVECDTAPVWVDGDPARIEQILTNLLVNAATYTAAGGWIRVRIAREDTTAVMEVSDDGQGIEPENLPRVFDLFFQGESTSDRSAGGLGIGLTLVQRLAALHGGDVK